MKKKSSPSHAHLDIDLDISIADQYRAMMLELREGPDWTGSVTHHKDEAAERTKLETEKRDRETIEASSGLALLVQKAMNLYETKNPNHLYKSYVTGMAHLHRKKLFATRVRAFVVLHKSLPPTETLEEWVRKDIPVHHR